MADFTFAIVVPLASPIQPVATLKDGTELTSRPLISSELGAFRNFKMVPAAPGVNSSYRIGSMPRPGPARVIRNTASTAIGTNRW